MFTVLGFGLTGLGIGMNAMKIDKLSGKTEILREYDLIIAQSLEVIFKHSNESNNKIVALKNASHEIVLLAEGTSRKLQLLELDIIRKEHTDFNLQTTNEAIDVSMAIMDSMFDGKLSTRIGEIYEIEE